MIFSVNFGTCFVSRVLKPTDYSTGDTSSAGPGCVDTTTPYTCGDAGSTTYCDGNTCKCKKANTVTANTPMYHTFGTVGGTNSAINSYTCRYM